MLIAEKLIFGLRWIAIAVIVIAFVLITIRRKMPSRPGSGARSKSTYEFWRDIWFRWQDAREDKREFASNMAALRGKRVLIADPDEKSVRILTWRLQKLRCSVTRTRTAAQALAKARELDPDAIVADALLADMTAVEFFENLPRPDVPLIFIGVLPSQWDQLRPLGRNVACLSKPFDPDDVASLAGMMVGRRA